MKRIFWFETAAVVGVLGVLLFFSRYGNVLMTDSDAVAIAGAFAAVTAVITGVAFAHLAKQGVSTLRVCVSLAMEAITVGVATWCVVQNHVFLAALGSAIGIALLATVCFSQPSRRLAFWKPAESR